MNKLFVVTYDICEYQTRSMLVMAESAEEAKQIARETWDDIPIHKDLEISFEVDPNWKGYITSFIE